MVIFAGSLPCTAAGENIVIIANTSVPVDSLSRGALNDIFLGIEAAWKDAQEISIALQEKSDIHSAFTNEFTNKSPSQFKMHWRKLVFLGQASQPDSFGTEQELIDYVAKNPGAIGYVSAAPQNDRIKTIGIE